MQLLVHRTGLVFQGPAQTPTPLRNWPRRPGSACRAGCWAPRIWLMMAWFRGYTPADSAPLMFRVLRLPLPLPRRVPQRLLEPRGLGSSEGALLSRKFQSLDWACLAFPTPPHSCSQLSCSIQNTHLAVGFGMVVFLQSLGCSPGIGLPEGGRPVGAHIPTLARGPSGAPHPYKALEVSDAEPEPCRTRAEEVHVGTVGPQMLKSNPPH